MSRQHFVISMASFTVAVMVYSCWPCLDVVLVEVLSCRDTLHGNYRTDRRLSECDVLNSSIPYHSQVFITVFLK